MKKSVKIKEVNPWIWYHTGKKDFSPGSKLTNRRYWEWEINHNNLKVL
jgi:hypothetical protein